jgi:hypothetical protein
MNFSGTRLNESRLIQKISNIHIEARMVYGLMIISALIAFEMFNYSTTDFALRDLLGDLKFFGIHWATILSIAFCGIDFAGIARLFTPERGKDEPQSVWFLFGAWLLAATMNALLTWWGVSMAIVSHSPQSSAVLDPTTLNKVVPIFVAIMVWVIRILIIGSLSVAGERLISKSKSTRPRPAASSRPAMARPAAISAKPALNSTARLDNSAPKPSMARPRSSMSVSNAARPEPTYHSVSTSSHSNQVPMSEPNSNRNHMMH